MPYLVLAICRTAVEDQQVWELEGVSKDGKRLVLLRFNEKGELIHSAEYYIFKNGLQPAPPAKAPTLPELKIIKRRKTTVKKGKIPAFLRKKLPPGFGGF